MAAGDDLGKRSRSRWALANRKIGSRAEVQLRSKLHRRGLRFRKNLLIRAAGFSVRPDIVFTRAQVAVFVDGCFWHSCPDHGSQPTRNADYWRPKLERNRQRDVLVSRVLRSGGWRVVRVWEHTPPHMAADVVAAAVSVELSTKRAIEDSLTSSVLLDVDGGCVAEISAEPDIAHARRQYRADLRNSIGVEEGE
jgi:DNA mismatch endonuclease (patch repair protein)